MATGSESRVVAFRSFGNIASMCSSMNIVPRSTSISTLSTTVSNMAVFRSPIKTSSLFTPIILNEYFVSEQSDVFYGTDACDFGW